MAGLGDISRGGSVAPSRAAAAAPVASGGGLGDISGGGSAAPGGNTEVQSVQAANDKLLGDISRSGNNGAIGAANAAAHHNSSNWFGDIIHALDIPRSVVASGTEQAGLALKQALGNGGPGASLQGFEQGVGNHVTFGHLLHTDAGIQNKWVDSLGGIVGDVATDPLTYAGGLGEVAKAAGVAGHVADAVNASNDAARLAETAAKTGDAADKVMADSAAKIAAEKTGNGVITGDTMARLQTKGVAGLTDPERRVLEQKILTETGQRVPVQTGLGMRVPGTKLFGNPKMLPLVPGALTDPVTSTLKNLTARAADTKVIGGLERALVPMGTLKGAVRAAALSGEGEKAATLAQMIRHAPESSGVARGVMNAYGPRAAEALNQIPDSVVHHVVPALEGSPDAALAIKQAGGGEGLGALKGTYNDLLGTAKTHGVDMGTIENYAPHQLTDAAKEAFDKFGNTNAARRAFANAVQKRGLVAGSNFLGHTLEEGSVEEINRIAHEVYGKDAFDVFKTDPREITANYIRGLSRTIGQHHYMNTLDNMGVTAHGDPALAPGDWVKLGEQGANAGRQAPSFVKDALQKITEEQTAGVKGGKFLQTYDKWLNVWKQYALAMPGKAIRHTLATPAWGTYLGNVGSRSLREGFGTWRAFQRAVAAHSGDVGAALRTLDPKMAAEIRGAMDHGIFHGHEFHMEDLTGPRSRTAKVNKFNPLSTKHGYFKANNEMQRRAQDYWRFAMYHDAVKKGMQTPEAAQKVRMMLGDPHNITTAERSTARRVVPFYTFLRQNLPVELKNVATQPGKFINAYQAPKEEAEQWSPGQPVVPQMFNQTMGVRLPWQIGGNQVYLSPDLPFTRIGQLFGGRNQLEAQTSPLLQDALAYLNNTQAFTGNTFSATAKPAPGAWTAIPGLMEALHAIDPNGVTKTKQTQSDFGQTTPAGQWVITPRDASMVESLIPLLSQARRVDTTEPNMKTRGDTSILSDLVGQNFRTNDPAQQAGELLRRQAILKQMVEHLQNQGELPKYLYGFHQ